MHYKIEGTIRRNKNRFIIFAILWLFMAIVIVMPIAYGWHLASVSGSFDFGIFLKEFSGAYSQLGTVIGSIATYIKEFWGLIWKFTIMYRNIYVYRICQNSSQK